MMMMEGGREGRKFCGLPPAEMVIHLSASDCLIHPPPHSPSLHPNAVLLLLLLLGEY